MASSTPGKQTVPRAELWAQEVVRAIRNNDGGLELRIDAGYVINGNSKAEERRGGDNGCLWKLHSDFEERRTGNYDAKKVKAREEQKVATHLDGKGNLRDDLGNMLADIAADVAANNARMDDQQVSATNRAVATAKNIIRRLAITRAQKSNLSAIYECMKCLKIVERRMKGKRSNRRTTRPRKTGIGAGTSFKGWQRK